MRGRAVDSRSGTAIAVLLAILASFLVCVEVGMRRVVVNSSRIERRIEREYGEARLIRRSAGARQLLVVGNSLLLTDVVFDSLRSALQPGWDARRLVVEQTAYFDWLYGLRALFARGATPDVVVLMLTKQQLVSSEFRGDYTAYRLMRPQDVLPLARDLGRHPTVTFGYLVSSVSAFYGLRGELRKVILNRVMPDLRDLTRLLPDRGVARPFDSSTYDTAADRLTRLKSLTEGNGIHLLIVLPPTLARPTAGDPVLAAAAAAGVTMLEATPPGTYSAEDFADGFHMNARGASHYTRVLSTVLREVLSRSDQRVGTVR